MTNLTRGNGESGAELSISGTIPVNASWYEDIYFTAYDGTPYDLTGLDFKLTLRASPDDATAEYTLSTDAGTLSIVEDTDAGVNSILRINVAAEALSSLDGDYVADLAMRDVSDRVFHWAHGIVSCRNNPIAF